MAPSPLDKWTAGCNLPHIWLVSLAMDLVILICVICGGENGINECHLAVFIVDVVFACNFVATSPPPILPPYRSASSIGYTSK